jgi:oxygen-independent coproporphyrinogen-3 oxidase
MDFIAGIPGQTVEDVRRDLGVVEGSWPCHVSLYQLTMEPGTPLAELVAAGRIALNTPQRDEELWFAGVEELAARGYAQYEVSNFCLPGKECRHNLRYWNLEPYVGAGPAAVSTVPLAWAAQAFPGAAGISGPEAVVRLATPKDIGRFLRGSTALWGMEIERISGRDFLLENLMMGFRLARGIERQKILGRFGHALEELLPGLWESWVAGGFALGGTQLHAMTPKGLLLLDRRLEEAAAAVAVHVNPDLRVVWP